VSDNFDDVIEWQQAVALDLCVDVLALSAVGEKLHQVGVVQQQAVRVQPVSLRPHQFNKHLEWSGIVEEDEDLIANSQQLQTSQTILRLNALCNISTVFNI